MELTRETVEKWRAAIRDDISAHYLLSMAIAIRFQEGAAAALPWLEKAQNAGAYQDAVAHVLSSTLRDLGENERAQQIHQKGIAQNPDHDLVALRDLGALYMNTSVVPEGACTELLREGARLAQERGHLAIAGETAARLALHHARHRQFKEADSALERMPVIPEVVAVAEETLVLLQEVARIAEAAKELSLWKIAAQSLISSVRSGSWSAIPALDQVAKSATRLEHTAILVAASKRALAIDPQYAPARLRLALHRVYEEDLTGGIDLLMEAVSGNFADDNLLAALSNLLFLAGRVDEAERHSAENLIRHPGSLGATQQRGLLLIATGQYEKAATLLQEWVHHRPGDPGPASTFAMALHHLGRSAEALEYLRPPLVNTETVPDGLLSWLQWYFCLQGVMQETLGRTDDAARSFTMAARQAKAREMRYHLSIRPTIIDAAINGLRRAGFGI